MLLRVFNVMAVSTGVLLANLIAWQVWLWTTSRGAHGAGFYRGYGPVFMLTGALFAAFGLFLLKR